MYTNPFSPQRRKSRYAELDFEVGPGVRCPTHPAQALQQVGRGWGEGLPSPTSGAQSPGACSGGARAAPFLAQGSLPPHPLQKIMHTRKRHQDMFQDLNRKLQHAEKDKDVLGPDSKVWRTGAGGGFGGRSREWGRGVGRAWMGL